MNVCAFILRPLLLAALCQACTSPPRPVPTNHFKADPADLATVRRVMVLPFSQPSGRGADGMQIRDVFLQELTKLQRFEVVPLPESASEHAEIHRDLTRGKLSTNALVALSERYNIDGVLIGTVTAYRPYPPMRLGMRTRIVSLHSGQTVWAAEGLYDANDARTVEDLRHYAATFATAEASLHGWELNMIAPTKYAAYVAHRLAATCR